MTHTNESPAIAFLRELAHELMTQDNAMTSRPIPTVREKELVSGFDADYTDMAGWYDHGNDLFIDSEDPEVAEMEARWQDDGHEPQDWSRSGYTYREKTVATFLTTKAAKAYIARRGHDHRGELRTYIESAYRNPELAEVRRLLSGPVLGCIEALQALAAKLPSDPRALGTYYAKDELIAARDALAALDTFKDPYL